MQASTITWQNIAYTNAAGASIDRQVGLGTDNIKTRDINELVQKLSHNYI